MLVCASDVQSTLARILARKRAVQGLDGSRWMCCSSVRTERSVSRVCLTGGQCLSTVAALWTFCSHHGKGCNSMERVLMGDKYRHRNKLRNFKSLMFSWLSEFYSIAADRSASIDFGFADPMYAVNWKDHSGHSLCSPVNIGASPIVRVST